MCVCVCVCVYMSQMFTALGDENHSRQEFVELREEARRHAMSFGINLHVIRKPLLALHQCVHTHTHTHTQLSDSLTHYLCVCVCVYLS